MRGYDRNEVYRSDGLDEYETDGEEEEVEDEYEEEEEAPKLTKEELEYLELRQKLKEAARRRMKKENGASVGNSSEKKYRPPNDNFGSFFGPSQPVIAQRVIQESKSLLENQHLAARISNSTNGQSKKAHASTNSAPRPGVRDPPPRVIHEAQSKLKAQKLKDNRDYSFLLSEDSEVPLPKKDPPPRNVPMTNSDARHAQAQSKSRQSGVNHNRPSSNGRDERRSAPTNHQVQKKPAYPQVASSSKQRPNMTSSDSRKQLGSNAGNGPGRPIIRPPSKMSAPPNKASLSNKFSSLSVDKKPSLNGIKRPVSGGVQKAPLPKVQSSMQRQEQRRDVREPERSRLTSRMSAAPSKLQSKPLPKHTQQRPPPHVDRPKKRPTGPYMDEDEDEDPRAMIRKMFRYNPNKFRDVDDDDSDMEANFEDIQKEEKRSARIAREEDEIEARLIEEEEKRERLRKEAKRRKLSQR